jgi:hypothetical protein
MTEVGSATEGLTGIFAGAGTATEEFSGTLDAVGGAADATVGGLTEANTAVEGVGTSATTAMGGIGQMAGAVTGLGSTIGLAVSTVFRMQDAQLALDKANLKAAKSTEMARKAGVAFDNLLKSATGNTAGITAARDELSAAQDKLNKLQEAGITSGAEYEAAQAGVSAATAALRAEFVAGGGDAAKFDAALNKMTNSTKGAEIAAKSAEKAQRTFSQAALDTGLSVASLVGQSVSAVAALKDIKAGAEKLAPIFKAVSAAIKPIAGVLAGMAAGFVGFIGIMTAIDQNVGGVKDALKGVHDEANKTVPALSALFDHLGKTFATNTEGFGAWGAEVMKALGIPVSEGPKAAAGLKGTADASTALGTTVVDTSAKLTAAMQATNGNTTAMGALQRTNADAQMTQQDFNAALAATKSEMDAGASSTGNLTQQMYQFYAAMQQTTDQALTLSNLFPEMGSNIDNALLGQKQGMTVAIQLWNDFRARVEAGQYQVGEFSQYIKDMGYELPPAIQGGVDKLTEMVTAAEGVTVSSKGATAGVKMFGTASVDLSNTVGKTANAVSDMNKSLVEQEYSLRASIAGLQDFGNQSQGVTNALLEVTNNFEKSNQAVREASAVRGNAKAQSELLHTALNKETESLINEEAALKADIAATTASKIQTLELSNAKLEGTKAAMEFISSLDEEKAKQEANIAVLRQSVSAMGVFGDATLQTAEQLQQFAAVAAGVPSAIRELAGEIGSLAQEATKFIEFADESDELFANWTISDKVPQEIKAMMSDADIAFIHGRAQLERTMESLGPLTGVKFAKAIQTAKQGGLAELRNFGPEAAALLREGFPTMDAALSELTNSFAALGTTTDAQMIPAMARVVTAMKNVEDPTASLAQQMIALSNTTGQSLAPLLGVAGGLEQLSAAGADATVKLSEIPIVKITDDAGNAVAEFANFNGQLLPIGGAAQGAAAGLGAMTGKINPLNAAIQLAGKTLEQFGKFVGNFFQSTLPSIVSSHPLNVNPFTGMISVSLASLNQFGTAVAQKMAQIRAAFSKGLGGVRQTGGGIPIQVNIAPALKQLQSLKVQITQVKQARPTPVNVDTRAATSAVNRLKSLVNSMPNIRRTITYTYRIVGSRPNPQNINRTITYRYRTVGTRPAQTGMHENLSQDTLIAAHRGERVDITPGTISSNENRTAIIPATGQNARPINIVVRGDVNGKELIRFVKFNLMEGTGGVM